MDKDFTMNVLDQKIDKNNIKNIIMYLKTVFGENYEFTYKETDGKFDIYVNDQVFINDLSSDYKVRDIITGINSAFGVTERSKSTDVPRKPLTTQAPPTSKIQISLFNVYQALLELSSANTILGDYAQYLDTSFITGELRSYYVTLNDDKELSLAKLGSFIESLATTIEYSLNIYQNAETQNYGKLEELIGALFSRRDEEVKMIDAITMDDIKGEEALLDGSETESLGQTGNSLLDSDEPISVEDYIDAMEGIDPFFDEQYAGLLEDFQEKLRVQYYKFLSNTVPKSLDLMVENIFNDYNRQHENYEYGSDDYNKALKDFKEKDFATSIIKDYQIDDIDNYNIEESSIPKDLWENGNIYDKSLLLLSFDPDGISKIKNKFVNTLKTILDKKDNSYFFNFNYKPFEALYKAEEMFKFSLESNNITDILTKYNDLFKLYENEPFYINSVLSGDSFPQGIGADGKLNEDGNNWVKALEDLGYLKDFKEGEYSQEDIYKVTCNLDFLSMVAVKDGEQGVEKIFAKFYENSGETDAEKHAEELLYDYYLSPYLTSCQIRFGVNNVLAGTLNELAEDKMTLDAAKSNFKLGLTKRIDTNGITDEDRDKAKELYGTDIEYLEPWQIDATAAILKSGKKMSIDENYHIMTFDGDWDSLSETDKNAYLSAWRNDGKSYAYFLKDDVFYDWIASRKGYEQAYESLMLYNGDNEEINEIINSWIPNKILSTAYSKLVGRSAAITFGLADGIYSSVQGIGNFFNPDGKRSSDDYRRMYLQELLTTDYSIYKDYQDPNRENHQEIVDMMSTNYDVLKNKGIILSEEELSKYQENNVSVYQILYAKGKISDSDYCKYTKLYERKDNPKEMNYFVSLSGQEGYLNFVNFEHNLASGIGNMIIPMALSAAFGPNAMSAWMFMSVTGSEREQYLQNGYANDGLTFLKAAAKGVAAVASERMLGSLRGYGKREGEILGIFKNYENYSGLGKLVAGTFSSMINETEEELFENVCGYVIDFMGDGTLPKLDALGQETWQTILYTMCTTPFINAMGGAMQGNKFSYVNRMQEFDMNGMKVRCTPAEIARFTDNSGNMNYKKFMKFLIDDGRIEGIASIDNQTQNTDIVAGNLASEKVDVIDVSQINTEGQNKDKFAHGVDSNVMNMSYKGYDFVYKTSGDANLALQQVVSEKRAGKILIELNSTLGLTKENLTKLPPNVEIRVLGDYGMEYFRGDKSNGSSIATLEKATYSVSEMHDILGKISTFESGINPNWNDTQKARYAYDFMVNNFVYNPNPGGIMVRDRQYVGLMSLLANESTCQGFAHTYKELLTRIGIDCTEISGNLNGQGQHAFNVVTIDGKRYIVDTVRENLGSKYNGTGFGVRSEFLSEYHFKSNTDLVETIQDGRLLEDNTDNNEESSNQVTATAEVGKDNQVNETQPDIISETDDKTTVNDNEIREKLKKLSEGYNLNDLIFDNNVAAHQNLFNLIKVAYSGDSSVSENLRTNIQEYLANSAKTVAEQFSSFPDNALTFFRSNSKSLIPFVFKNFGVFTNAGSIDWMLKLDGHSDKQTLQTLLEDGNFKKLFDRFNRPDTSKKNKKKYVKFMKEVIPLIMDSKSISDEVTRTIEESFSSLKPDDLGWFMNLESKNNPVYLYSNFDKLTGLVNGKNLTEFLTFVKDFDKTQFSNVNKTSLNELLKNNMQTLLGESRTPIKAINIIKNLNENLSLHLDLDGLTDIMKDKGKTIAIEMIYDTDQMSDSYYDSCANDNFVEILDSMLNELVENENVSLSDIEYLGEGGYSKVFLVGDKVIKIGKHLPRTMSLPKNNSLLMQPLIRRTIDDKYIEISEKCDTSKTYSNDELYEIYKELRKDGLIWTDAKSANVGTLIKDNKRYLSSIGEINDDGTKTTGSISYFNDENIPLEEGTEQIIRKPGQPVIIDLDFIYDEKDPNIWFPDGGSLSESFEKRYQEELRLKSDNNGETGFNPSRKAGYNNLSK